MCYSIFENMVNACFKSGDILREYFESCNYTITQKTTPFDLVTTADKESQECIISALSSCYPDIAIISEEGAKIKKCDRVFYVDPLDGTLNFVHKFPFFAVSIGYWENGKAIFGVVFEPIKKIYSMRRRELGRF